MLNKDRHTPLLKGLDIIGVHLKVLFVQSLWSSPSSLNPFFFFLTHLASSTETFSWLIWLNGLVFSNPYWRGLKIMVVLVVVLVSWLVTFFFSNLLDIWRTTEMHFRHCLNLTCYSDSSGWFSSLPFNRKIFSYLYKIKATKCLIIAPYNGP